QLFLEIRNYFVIPSFQGSLCFYLSYGMNPLQVICFIVNYFYFLRYFSIINLNENKKNIYNNLKKGGSIEKIHRIKNTILKIISSPFFTISLLVISYLILIFINTIIIISETNIICRFSNLLSIKIVLNVELI